MTQINYQSNINSEMIDAKTEEYLRPVKDLSKIYPDIEGQLCSRHSSLLGKLKSTFNKMYDNLDPTHYVIVKGNTYIIGNQEDEVELSMGLQNGIIILVSQTYLQSNIYVNGNHMDQQLIFNYCGKLQQGLYEMSEDIQKICQSAISDSSIDKLFGGIIYIHANIPQGFYNYKNSFLTALFLSILAINNQINTYSIQQIINKLTQTKLIDQLFLQKQFYDYQNRQFSLTVGTTMYKVPLNKQIKLLFCRLDLAHCDIKHSQTSIKQQKQDKDKILAFLNKNYGIKSFYQAFQSQLQVKIQQLSLESNQNKEYILNMRLIQAQLQQLKSLCEFSNNIITAQQLINMKWLIDSKMRYIFSQQVIELVESIKAKTGIQACTIVQGQYLMMAADRSKYTELIITLRQLLHKGQLKSKSCFKLQEQLIENRWGNQDNGVGQKIFVSVPSKGIAIFDPSQSIWFD